MLLRPGVRSGRLLTGLAAAAIAAMLLPAAVVSADAGISAPPTRLYVAPAGSVMTLPFDQVPAGSIAFVGQDDISKQDRPIVITADAGADCSPDVADDWNTDDCPRVQLTVGNGTLSMGAVTTETDSNGQPVYLLDDGAVVDQMANAPDGPTSLIHINGTVAALNFALQDLIYTPEPGYRWTGSDPETLHIVVTSGADGADTASHDVDIRVLDINGWPTVEGPASPATATSGVDLLITGHTVEDEDNDEDVDGAQADPPVPGDDPVDGAETALLLVGAAPVRRYGRQ